MALSSDLVSQFVKATRDDTKTKQDVTVYGTVVEYEGKKYVKIDGSDLRTPVTTTTAIKDNDRVTVMIKDHTATVTGNLTSPSVGNAEVESFDNKITELGVVVARKVDTDEFTAEIAKIDQVVADNVLIREELTAANANITVLQADNVTINEKLTATEGEFADLKANALTADVADLKYATIVQLDATDANLYNLTSAYAEFKDATVDDLTAINADITRLNTDKLSASDIEGKYANIDFSNIGEAAITKIFSDSGIIKDLIVNDGKITGELVGVTIKGDLIEGNTVKADKLVVLGEDGLYYKLNVNSLGEATASSDEKYQNGLDGSVIIAKSITADRVAVTDLVAFGATIGGFKITENSIYSGVKESVDNATRGVYLDNTGQVNFGDATNFVKYFKDGDVYKLEIAAATIKLGASNRDVETIVNEANQKAEDVNDLATEANALATEAKEKCDLANGNASAAIETATSNQTRLDTAELSIDSIQSIIQALITGPNGETLMTQTDTGWVFNFATETNNSINNMNSNITSLENTNNLNGSLTDELRAMNDEFGKYSDYIRFGTDENGSPYMLLGETDSAYKVKITNQTIDFVNNSDMLTATIDSDENNTSYMYIDRARIQNELEQGGFAWQVRNNGKNYGLRWKGVV